MQRSVLCKFFAQGACLKGEFCDFAHDLSIAPQKKACIYYQRGTCTYGGRCRFEHARSFSTGSSASSSSAARPPITSNDSPLSVSSGDHSIETKKNPSVVPVLSSAANNPIATGDSAINSTKNLSDSAVPFYPSMGSNPSDIPTEPCAENGGNVIMDLCSTCGKYCLHPSKTEEREKHVIECEKNKLALECSRQIECSVCLERVLSKTSASERKFGLLSECDHAFCIACIKIWRSSSSISGLEVSSAARTCPVCRKVSYYVIPSPIWSSSKEEKQDIINKYKAKLKSIDCRYFNFGNGHCRHGTSCFYKHEVKAGSSRRRKSSSKGKNKRINSQNRATWDDDRLGFGELVELSLLDAMLEEFEELFFVNEEAMRDGAPADEALDSLAELYMKLEELGMSLESDSDDFDPNFEYDPNGGAIRLEPWQRRIFYEQTGYYDFDDFTNCGNLGFYGSDDDE